MRIYGGFAMVALAGLVLPLSAGSPSTALTLSIINKSKARYTFTWLKPDRPLEGSVPLESVRIERFAFSGALAQTEKTRFPLSPFTYSFTNDTGEPTALDLGLEPNRKFEFTLTLVGQPGKGKALRMPDQAFRLGSREGGAVTWYFPGNGVPFGLDEGGQAVDPERMTLSKGTLTLFR